MVNPLTGKEVAYDEVRRGFPLEDGVYVILDEEELDALEPEKSRDIEITGFVEPDGIEPSWYDRPYNAGIATFVMRAKEYLIAILAENGILRAETLRFPDQIRALEDIDVPDAKPKAAQVKKIEKAIASLTRKELDPAELADEDAHELLALVEEKRQAGEDVVAAPEAALEDGETAASDIIDLMEVLKRSMQGEAAAARRGNGGARKKRSAKANGSRGKRSGRAKGDGRTQGDGDLRELSKDELYDRAQSLDTPGRSGMTKAELIRALRRSA